MGLRPPPGFNHLNASYIHEAAGKARAEPSRYTSAARGANVRNVGGGGGVCVCVGGGG